MIEVNKIDKVNFGIIIFSALLACILPFELFLFSYAFLGPLHYLTEINWLHNKNYFTQGKYDFIFLIVLSVCIALTFLYQDLGLTFIKPFDAFSTHFVMLGFLGAAVMVFIKNPYLKIISSALLVFGAFLFNAEDHINYWLFFSLYLPTIIHVFIFTALFMLFGAIKSKSKWGYYNVALIFVAAAILLFIRLPYQSLLPLETIKESYSGFFMLNQFLITDVFKFFNKQELTDMAQSGKDINEYLVFSSGGGYAVMRFIAFAYTYHYLNWFSKTSVIQWHKVSKPVLSVMIIIWIASIGVYLYDYNIGLKWLFLLSFMHVLLEFPLNYHSVTGIIKGLFAGNGDTKKPTLEKVKISTKKNKR